MVFNKEIIVHAYIQMADGHQGGHFVKCRHHDINGGVMYPLSGNCKFTTTWSLWQCNIQEGPCHFAIFRDQKAGIQDSGCYLLVFLLNEPQRTSRTFTDLDPSIHAFAERAIER